MNGATQKEINAFRAAARALGHQVERNQTVVIDKDGDAFLRVGQYPSRLYVFILRSEMEHFMEKAS